MHILNAEKVYRFPHYSQFVLFSSIAVGWVILCCSLSFTGCCLWMMTMGYCVRLMNENTHTHICCHWFCYPHVLFWIDDERVERARRAADRPTDDSNFICLLWRKSSSRQMCPKDEYLCLRWWNIECMYHDECMYPKLAIRERLG